MIEQIRFIAALPFMIVGMAFLAIATIISGYDI